MEESVQDKPIVVTHNDITALGVRPHERNAISEFHLHKTPSTRLKSLLIITLSTVLTPSRIPKLMFYEEFMTRYVTPAEYLKRTEERKNQIALGYFFASIAGLLVVSTGWVLKATRPDIEGVINRENMLIMEGFLMHALAHFMFFRQRKGYQLLETHISEKFRMT